MFIYLHAFCFHTAKEELCMTDSVYTEKPKNFLSSSLQKKKKNQPLT